MASDTDTSRYVLTNRTNIDLEGDASIGHPGLSNDRKEPVRELCQVSRKRRHHQISQDAPALSESSDEDDDITFHHTRLSLKDRSAFGGYGFTQRWRASATVSTARPEFSTRSMLRTFVSSDKADVFKCYSCETDSFVTLPYACAFSHDAKRGGTPLLAVATEQGVVHILNTARRRDWDVEPQRTTFQPYANGIFDVQWSQDDTLIATASGGQSAQVSQIQPTGVRVLHHLQGHTGTVKCVAWDPTRGGSVLSTGGRDGNICVWDLRVGQGSQSRTPVITIAGAHDEEGKVKPRARKGKLTPAAPLRSVTSLLYSENSPNELVSSGSMDGIIRQWDLLMPDMIKRSGAKRPKPKGTPVAQSTLDPTVYDGSRRPRGISSLSFGTGPTASYIFALGNDSLVHTYETTTLEPLSGRTADPEDDPWSYGHSNMRTSTFYVRSAVSPCGRWLASGGAEKGSVFLFDISGSTVSRWSSHPGDVARRRGVQLRGQSGEVGVVDWADGVLASCADDGTVRIWRPDLDIFRQCQEDPEEMKWNWKWALDEES